MSEAEAKPVDIRPALGGGDFLFQESHPQDCFFPEDFTQEQREIARTTAAFAEREVLGQSRFIEEKNFAVIRDLMKQAAELGLTSVDVPEEYGGLGMDKVTSALIVEKISIQGSFATTFTAHTGIGMLPLIWYGTPAQKAKYLPRLADGTTIAAYALSESSSGSDALNARTRAVLSGDGKTYTLNGEKMWITNGGFADVYTVFAKCAVRGGADAGKERLTAFLIERGTPGFSSDAEEHKLGIRGSSTTPLNLSDCVIPAANLLGEEGKGHHIAFNILNVGRYKLGNVALGAAKYAFRNAIEYAKNRKAFGKPIAEFGLVQEKIAKIATAIYVAECIVYRTVGAIDEALREVDTDDSAQIQKKISAFASECSIVKVWASEMLDMVADESLQIFGGYGYVEDFPAERSYRDARIHRIFEGTNEINRLIIAGMLVKSISANANEVPPAEQKDFPSPKVEVPLSRERSVLRHARQLTRVVAAEAVRHFGSGITEQQEIMGSLADMVMTVYALESAILRAEKIRATSEGNASKTTCSMAAIYAVDAYDVISRSARRVTAAMPAVKRDQYTRSGFSGALNLADTIALGREVSSAAIRAGKYSL